VTEAAHTDAQVDALILALRATGPTFSLDERAVEAIYTLGYGYLDRGDSAMARVSFDFLTAQAPGDARFWAGLGYCLLDCGAPGEALTPFGLATRLDPGNAGFMLGLGRAYLQADLAGHAAYAFGVAEAMARQAGDTELAEKAKARLELMGFAP
jgi:tetratricopeptide (TPR) repeat protein